jgi:hypothetical protein
MDSHQPQMESLGTVTSTTEPRTSQERPVLKEERDGGQNGNHFKGQICTNRICTCKSMQSYKLKVILGLSS